jgi:cell division initiation protein
MTLTPVEVRHLELRRGLLGYRRSHVHRTIEEIADSFEDVWRERSELTERVHDLEGEVARHVELETLLRSTLVSAERAAQDMKEHARREADVIVQEAGAEGRRLIRDAIAEKEQLLAETRRVRSIMRAALDVLAEGQELQGENDRDEPAERAEAATPQLTEPPAASTKVDRLAG